MFTSPVLAALSLQSALIAFALALAMLLITAVLLLWSRSARQAYAGVDTVIFARSPWPLIVGALVFAACMVVIALLGVDSSSGLFVAAILVALFDLVFYGQFFLPSLVFYVADASGLTRQLLGVKTTLAWYDIDWVYGARKTTSYRTYGIKTGQSTQESLMVEAGARRKIKITLRAWLVRGNPEALLSAIQTRATNALIGFDKMPVVQQRRAAGVLPGSR